MATEQASRSITILAADHDDRRVRFAYDAAGDRRSVRYQKDYLRDRVEQLTEEDMLFTLLAFFIQRRGLSWDAAVALLTGSTVTETMQIEVV